jgi:hypothetical protein
MARRTGGGAGRAFPGIRAALADRFRYLDAAFCLEPLADECALCARVAELESGQSVEVTGEQVWRALFTPSAPKAHREFLHDATVYELTGDRLTATPDREVS